MANWRVVLLVGAVLAVVLVGASIWVKDHPTTQTFVTPPARLSSDPNSYWYHVYSRARTMTAANHSLADQRADYLRFAAAAVAILTLASIPLPRERERRQAATG